ncbi:zinc finger protein 668-like [Anopheles darlingi]|uniref:zinc finger protein 668-like n=1 Tax=Anopheles darlingi TaxID=43151 RepID=UPI0020FFF963|nr:zinc finger protein 668-like [Anopheles darlingi]
MEKTNRMERVCRVCCCELSDIESYALNTQTEHGSLDELLRYCTSAEVNRESNLVYRICVKCRDDLMVAYRLVCSFHKATPRFMEEQLVEHPPSIESSKTSETNCKKCHQTFSTLPELKLHRRQHGLSCGQHHHSPNQKPKCCGCLEEFDSLALLRLHSDTVHKSEQNVLLVQGDANTKPFVCDVCFRRYKTRRILNDHRQRPYRTKRYQCARCGKSFRDRNSLEDHERVHGDDRPFVCGTCGKTFAMKDSYRKHQQLHTVEADRFKCDQCGKGCRTKGNLKDHYITHAITEKPTLSCPQCEQIFMRKGSLKSHLRLHTGEKPFRCEQCDACYAFPSDLRRHLMAHNGIKPFVCSVCQRAYPRRDYLAKHIASSHAVQDCKDTVEQ